MVSGLFSFVQIFYTIFTPNAKKVPFSRDLADLKQEFLHGKYLEFLG